MYILAIIGLIAILWLLSKAFNKLGNGLNKIGDAIADWQTSQSRSPKEYNSEAESKKIKEKIKAIKGKGTDDEYYQKIRAEINELTKE